jgi:4-amino-4-deoxy-L-arabinose transferase-like glycosyltransferase
MGTEPQSTFLARRGDAIAAGLLSLGALALLVATLDDYGMAWDEGFTVEREERLAEWFARASGRGGSGYRAWSPALSKLERRAAYLRRAGTSARSPWSRESLRFYWQFARAEPNGHPPFYALLGLAGWAVSHRALPPPASYRLGPAALFALTVGVAYRMVARHYGRAAGLMAALGLVAMPRMFAHAHLASYDVPTFSLWFLAVAAFLRAIGVWEGGGRPRTWVIAFGMLWGCAMATKFTGWFLPVPLACFAALYRDRRAVRALAGGGVIAAVVVYSLIPTWWAEPIQGLRAFLVSNLTRDRLLPIPTVFFGRLYLFSLPWYNTLVWTAIVVPPATLALALTGIGRVVAGRFRDRLGTLLVLSWVILMVLKALPSAPGHDGERLFLPAFGFLACLAGLGLATVGSGLARFAAPRAVRALTGAVLAGAVTAGAWSTWRYHPLQLSYYNALIGGLSGAARAGLEPTFYWEAVTPDVRDWLNRHTPPDGSVAFAFPAVTFEYVHRWGLLRPSPLTPIGQGPHWFVVMNRPGHLRYPGLTLGQYMLDHARPVYVKTLPEAPDVPLVAIFSGKDAVAAEAALKRLTK